MYWSYGVPWQKLSRWSSYTDWMAEFKTGDLVNKGVIFGCFAFFSISLYTSLNVAVAASIVCLNIRHLSIKLLTSKKLSTKSHTICRTFFRAMTVSCVLSTTALEFPSSYGSPSTVSWSKSSSDRHHDKNLLGISLLDIWEPFFCGITWRYSLLCRA